MTEFSRRSFLRAAVGALSVVVVPRALSAGRPAQVANGARAVRGMPVVFHSGDVAVGHGFATEHLPGEFTAWWTAPQAVTVDGVSWDEWPYVFAPPIRMRPTNLACGDSISINWGRISFS